MKGLLSFLKTFSFLKRRVRKGESGFTLVELLVVVGIIVALAAVIIPNVAQFAGKGETGAKAAEQENVQTAFDAMLADVGITVVTANTGAITPAINDFSATPVEGPLGTYLRSATTTYFYCWDTSALILLQQLAAADNC